MNAEIQVPTALNPEQAICCWSCGRREAERVEDSHWVASNGELKVEPICLRCWCLGMTAKKAENAPYEVGGPPWDAVDDLVIAKSQSSHENFERCCREGILLYCAPDCRCSNPVDGLLV